ncbi:MAG TPA: polysaccharide biosynthesis/export family protein [Luteitalea sp.]|nr:polysaccharide biosynthesis/export family protein [Luteitalea sp.]
MFRTRARQVVMALALFVGAEGAAVAQPAPTSPTSPTATDAAAAPVDAGFTIGPEDVLSVLVWREADVSGEVTVRADGMITLPLIRDVKAAGLTPNQLAEQVQAQLREFITDASVTVVVRQMNSRKAFITGEVAKPGAYPLVATTTVMQLIALAGGLTEFAESNAISVMRIEDGKTTTLKFAYKDVAKGKKAEQNIVLRPGDTVVVPEK